VWAGVIPLRMVRMDPVPDPALPVVTSVPEHLLGGRLAPGTTPVGDLGPRRVGRT